MTKKRIPKVPPGTTLRLDELDTEESRRAFATALTFASDYDAARSAWRDHVARMRGEGLSDTEIIDRLVHVLSHNAAVRERAERPKREAALAAKKRAEHRQAEIAEQLKDSGGIVKAVAIDRQGSGRPGNSESTIRRVKRRISAKT